MAETPTHGKKFMGLSKNQLILVMIGGAAVVFVVYKHYQSSSAAVAATTATNSTGTAAADIDPATGYQYGSVEDEQALAGLSGSSSGDEYDSGYGGVAESEPYYSTSPVSQVPSTNAAWSQEVQQQLGAIGYDSETVAGAVGAYLAQIPLTATQAGIVQVALAEVGPPPQGEYSIIPQGTSTPVTNPTVPVPPTTKPKKAKEPLDQSGTVHSITTNENAPVTTSDGGYTWKYTGKSGPTSKDPKTQHGTVHSTTTGGNASVRSYNAGITWQFVN